MNAFTLAEVLITLAIIGIVAALTIPNLIYSYQKRVYETSFSKAYYTLNNGFKNYIASQGCTDIACAGLGEDLLTKNSGNWANVFKQIFKISHVCDFETSCKYNLHHWFTLNGYDLSGENASEEFYFVLTDGTRISFAGLDVNGNAFNVYTNGTKGPNRLGYDIFAFNLDYYGNIQPFGATYRKYTGEMYNGDNWDEMGLEDFITDPCSKFDYKSQEDNGGNYIELINSMYCAERIIKDGFKIKYF